MNFGIANRLQSEYNTWFMPELLSWNEGRNFLPDPDLFYSWYLLWKIRLDADSSGILTKEDMQELQSKYDNGRIMLVMYYDNVPAGTILLDLYPGPSQELKEKVGELHAVYIRPEFRGKKLGKVLIDEIKKIARHNEFDRLILDTNPFMKAAVRLYESCGFERVDFIDFFYANKERAQLRSAIFMSIDL